MKYKRGLFCSILTSAALLGAVSAPSVHASLDSTTGGSVSGSSGAAISGSRELPTSLQVAAARSAYAISQGISVSELDKADEAGLRVSEMQRLFVLSRLTHLVGSGSPLHHSLKSTSRTKMDCRRSARRSNRFRSRWFLRNAAFLKRK